MDSSKILKVVIFAVVILLAFPFVLKLIPEPLTMERIQAGFAASGLPVAQMQQVNPTNESVAELAAIIGVVTLNVYQYNDEGKIARYTEYQKKDAGTAIVETWNLSESLGAAPRRDTPSKYLRRGMFLAVATGNDVAMVDRVIEAFKGL